MGIFQLAPESCRHRVDIRCFEEHEEAAALLHCTGSGMFNRVVQRVALAKGMQLSEKGLCAATHVGRGEVRKTGPYLPLRTEQDIFERLGLEYRHPREREHRHDVVEATTGRPFFEKLETRRKRGRVAGDQEMLALEGPLAASSRTSTRVQYIVGNDSS
jgi:hypothetical protein